MRPCTPACTAPHSPLAISSHTTPSRAACLASNKLTGELLQHARLRARPRLSWWDSNPAWAPRIQTHRCVIDPVAACSPLASRVSTRSRQPSCLFASLECCLTNLLVMAGAIAARASLAPSPPRAPRLSTLLDLLVSSRPSNRPVRAPRWLPARLPRKPVFKLATDAQLL